MSAAQVQRLQQLLSRVQENRHEPRTTRMPALASAVAAPAAKPVAAAAPQAKAPTAATPMAAAAAAPMREPSRAVAQPRERGLVTEPRERGSIAEPRERGSITEERVNLPDRGSLPQKLPARPQQQPVAREPAAQESRKPMRDRTATPLEMAVEGELNRPDLAEAAPTRESIAKPAARSATSATERLMPAVAAQRAPARAAFAEEPDLELEPELVAEPARPIAQVVSKHTPQLDATFGAMLKRSLSLRPH